MMNVIDVLQSLSWDWGVRSFGEGHMTDSRVRALRFVEEAVEVAQASYVSREQLHLLVDQVYAKPAGDVAQEMGGCMVTLSVLLKIYNYDMEEVFLREVSRVLSKPPEYFAQRNRDKIDGGLS